jgi:cell division protein FtsW
MGSTLFLLLLGLVMVYSASSVSDLVNTGDSSHHLKRQLMWIAVGLVLLLAVRRFDYRRLKTFSWPIYFISLAGLVAVLAVGVGKWGAQRWLAVGGYTIQPSEYAKLACVMVTAFMLTQLKRRELDPKEFWVRVSLATAAVVFLVMLQPDMGTTMSIVLSVYLVLLLGGINWGALMAMAMAGAGAALGAILIADYRAARLFAFLDPRADPQGSGYQTIQAMLAFGSGGVDGVGLGMSRQKFFYLPAAHTDFIFAIIGEELGLIGTLAIVLGFVVFAYAGVRIALGTRDTFGRLLAGGLTAMIVTQALMNMAAVTGLMPVTGIPMPLVSFGGSSLTFTMLCIGIMLSISLHGTRGVRPVRKRTGDGGRPQRARSDERRRNSRTHLSGIDGGRQAGRRRA